MQLIDDTHYTKAIREWNKKFHIVAEMSPLRAALIDEEVGELCSALGDKDIQGIIDGLCDVIYVAAGTQVAKGTVMVTDAIDFTPGYSSADDDLELLTDIEADVSLAHPTADMFLASLVCHCELIAKKYNIDLRANFDIVHANNMAKVWTREQISQVDISSYDITIVGDGTYIIKSPAGKVIKPLGHPKPQLIIPV